MKQFVPNLFSSYDTRFIFMVYGIHSPWFYNSFLYHQVPANFGTIQKISLAKPHLPIELPKFDPLAQHEVRTETRPVQVIVNFTQYCPPVEARGLFWNLTKAVSNSYFWYI